LTKKWLITKNVLALVLIFLALSALYIVLPIFSHRLEILSSTTGNGHILGTLTLFPLMKLHANIFNYVVMFWGAFWLLKGKSEGWLVSVVIAILSVLLSIKSLFSEPSAINGSDAGRYWGLILAFLLQLLVSVLLLMKPVRNAYRPDRAAWLVSIVVASIHIILQFVFHE